MFLDDATFKTVVSSTPLISIDLIVRNELGQILLGKRTNRPAQNFWFVPGGRILKNETIQGAFVRLCSEELGINTEVGSANFLGTFEHFYEDSIFGDSVSTHYVVLGYEITIELDFESMPKSQHTDYSWYSVEDMATASDVHKHSKWYLEAIA